MRRWPLGDVLALAQQMDRHGRLLPVRHCPDDVLWAKRGVTAEEHARVAATKCGLVDHRHAPFVEGDAGIALDPGERILLANRNQYIVAFVELVGFTAGAQPAALLLVVLGLYLLEHHPGQLAVRMDERLWHQEIE